MCVMYVRNCLLHVQFQLTFLMGLSSWLWNGILISVIFVQLVFTSVSLALMLSGIGILYTVRYRYCNIVV